MGEPIIFVGLDVHKDTITVALADEGQRGEVREYGRIANTPADLKKLVDKLGRTGRSLGFRSPGNWRPRETAAYLIGRIWQPSSA